MTFGKAIEKCFRDWNNISGRSLRSEFWFFFLFCNIVIFAAMFFDNLLGTTLGESPYGILYILSALIITVPSITVGVRRLHDTNRSGWWYFIGFVPLIGSVVLLIFFVLKGTNGENKYGVAPLLSEG